MASEISSVDLNTLPTPDHITLLLKHHKSTVLLSVLPDQSFTSVKTYLLAVLSARGATTLPGTDTPLPNKPDDIEFGILKDRRDASKGWILLEIKEQDLADIKGGKRKVGGKKSVLNESPAGAGLGDGSLVAYRVKSTANDEEDSMTDILDDPGWDVILPTYDDEPENEDVDPS